MVFTERFSPEIEIAFADYLKRRGITTALFDLDDTILATDKLFKDKVGLFLDYCLTRLSNINEEELKENFVRIGNALYHSMGVVPRRWEAVVDQLEEIYGVGLLRPGISHLYDIYQTAPDIFDGAKDTLSICKQNGLQMGLVTHASPEWTELKLNAHSLKN